MANKLGVNRAMLSRTLGRFARAGTVILVFYLLILGGFVLGVREYYWRVITLSLLGGLWGGWLGYKIWQGTDPPRTSLELPLLAMLAASALATLFSTDPRLSLGRLGLNGMLVISLYFTLDWLRRPERADLLLDGLLATGGVVCLVGLVEYGQWYAGSWVSPVSWQEAGLTWNFASGPRIKSILHNPNYLAYFLLVPFGLALYKILKATTRWRWLGWLAFLGMVIVTLLLTKSRGGLLAGATMSLVGGGLSFIKQTGREGWTAAFFKQPRYLAMAIILAGAVLLLLLPILGRTNLDGDQLLGERENIWQGGLDIFMAYPWLGAGPGTYPAQYMIYRNQDGHAAIFTHAHNVWLTIAAEYGLLGVAAVALFFVGLAALLLRYLRETPPRRWSPLLLAGVTILAGQAVHNLVDDFMEFPSFSWFTVLAVALCLAALRGDAVFHAPALRWGWLGAMSGGVLLMIGSLVWYGPAFAAYDQARLASQEENWGETVRWLEEAVALDPHYRFYRQQLALAYGYLVPVDEQYLALALAEQEKLYREFDHHYAPDAAYLGCLYGEAGRPTKALTLLERAIDTTPQSASGLFSYHFGRSTFYFNRGYYLEQLGRSDQAQAAYAHLLERRPSVRSSPYWSYSDLGAELTSSPVMTVPLHLELYRAGLSHLAAGNLAQAEAAAKQGIARSNAERAPAFHYLWGQIAARRGDLALAGRNYEQAIALSLTIRTDYANLVGQRQPLATEKPFCLLIPYPAEYLSQPALALAELALAEDDPALALAVYQTLLRYEPYNIEAAQKMEQLLADPAFNPAVSPATSPAGER